MQSLCRIISLARFSQAVVTWSEELLCPYFLGAFPDQSGWSVRSLCPLCYYTANLEPLWLHTGKVCAAPLALQRVSLSRVSWALVIAPFCALARLAPSSRLSTALAHSSHLAGWISPGRDSTRLAGDLCSLPLDSAVEISFGASGTAFFWHSVSTWFPLSVLLKNPSRATAEALTLRPMAFKLSLLFNQTCLRGTKEKIAMKASWNSTPNHCYLGCKNNMEE